MRKSKKTDQIISAAIRVFLQHGYAATSMETVAREATVSKATLYVYFKSKEDLFAAVVLTLGDQYTAPLLADGGAQEDMQATLLRFGHTVLDLLLATETVSSFRMVMAEAGRTPQLGQLFYQSGAARLLRRLEIFFGDAMKTGLLRPADPRRAAEQFIGLVRGDLQLRALLGIDCNVSAEQKNTIIQAGVETFHRAYRPGKTWE